MTEQEKAISKLCIEIQHYCNDLRIDHNFLADSYNLNCIEDCIEQIHRLVNPEFNDICEAVEEAMAGDDACELEENNDNESGD